MAALAAKPSLTKTRLSILGGMLASYRLRAGVEGFHHIALTYLVDRDDLVCVLRARFQFTVSERWLVGQCA